MLRPVEGQRIRSRKPILPENQPFSASFEFLFAIIFSLVLWSFCVLLPCLLLTLWLVRAL